MLRPNSAQVDTNGDDYGNACDTDVNNDGITNFGDASVFIQTFLGEYDPDCDFNSDGVINFGDVSTLIFGFGAPPGPSGTAGGTP